MNPTGPLEDWELDELDRRGGEAETVAEAAFPLTTRKNRGYTATAAPVPPPTSGRRPQLILHTAGEARPWRGAGEGIS